MNRTAFSLPARAGYRTRGGLSVLRSVEQFTGGANSARVVLSTIAGSMITVAGTTYSITIVALTLASTQFAPRVLRSFMRNRTNQVVLGFFVAAFTYCLLVLEAGGLIGDLSGEGNYLHGGQCIAGSPKIFAEMVTTLAPYRQDMERARSATAGGKT